MSHIPSFFCLSKCHKTNNNIGETMNDMFMSRAMRFFIAITVSNIWIGLYLTGFSALHWFAYVTPIFLTFATFTGICPGYIISKILFKNNKENE